MAWFSAYRLLTQFGDPYTDIYTGCSEENFAV